MTLPSIIRLGLIVVPLLKKYNKIFVVAVVSTKKRSPANAQALSLVSANYRLQHVT